VLVFLNYINIMTYFYCNVGGWGHLTSVFPDFCHRVINI
jgi:hypothetical protein